MTQPTLRRPRRCSDGFSLLEVIVATFILGILATAIITTGVRSRRQIDYDEVRRGAIAVAEERLETVRGSFAFDDIVPSNIDTTVVLDGTSFTLSSVVEDGIVPGSADSLDDYMKTVTDTVSWVETRAGANVTRRVTMSTAVFRDITP